MNILIFIWIISTTMLLICALVLKFTPSEPNYFMGVRTKKSMLNTENWLEINQNVYRATLKISVLSFIINGIIALVPYILSVELSEPTLILIILIMMFDGLIAFIVSVIFYNFKL